MQSALEPKVREISEPKELDEYLARSVLVIVDFSAEWCPPCKKMKPFFDILARKNGDVVFLSVMVDDDKLESLSEKFVVNNLPTFIGFNHGEEVERVVGASEEKLQCMLDSLKCKVSEIKGEQDLRKYLASAERVIVDFSTHWCPPCKKIRPFFNSLAGKYPDVLFLSAMVDSDELDCLTRRFEIVNIPTFITFYRGREAERTSGTSEEKLANMVNNLAAK